MQRFVSTRWRPPIHAAGQKHCGVNGVFGLKTQLKPESYRLQVVGVRDAERSPFYVRDPTAWEYGYEAAASQESEGHDTKTDPSKMSSIKMAPEGMQQKTEQDENHTGRKPRGLEEAGESNSTLSPGTPGLLLQLEDFVPRLQHHELVLQFKCIEGWSQIVQWAGVRFADFIDMFPPAPIDGKEPRYVYMETPDGDYYVGYDLHAPATPPGPARNRNDGSAAHAIPRRTAPPVQPRPSMATSRSNVSV